MNAAAAELEPRVCEVRDVSVERDGHRLVERASLDVARGSLHVIAGPNGGGKSTLLAAMVGLVPFSGAVRYHFLAGGRVGFVPQTFPIDATLPLTVGEFLALPRQRRPVCFGIARATRARVNELLDRVGLGALSDRRLGALSGGELRRVLVANAIDPEPELLMLDEPGSGLDRASAARLEEIVMALVKRGVGVVMVSHDLEQARRIADRVTVLDRIVLRSGAAAEMLNDPREPAIAEEIH